jgi:ATP-binding cassette, subfamily B, bacterial MsbA
MPRKRSRDEVIATLRRASVYLVPYRGTLALVFLLIVTVSLFSLTFPALQGCIIDIANGHPPRYAVIATLLPHGARGLAALGPLVALFALLLTLRAVALLTRNHLMQITGMRATCDVRVAIFSHLQKLSLRFYEERQTGRVVARVT